MDYNAIVHTAEEADPQAIDANTLLTYRERLHEAKRLITEACKEYDANVMMPYLEAHGPIQTETTLYKVGVTKTTKCKDVAATVEALLAVSQGDVSDFCDRFLSSSAIKYGACREPLGEKWDEFFEVEEKADVKEGAPKKGVLTIPTFLLTKKGD